LTAEKKITIQTEKDLLCRNRFGTFFGVTQQTFDHVWHNLTGPDGNSVTYISMEIGADPDVFHPLLDFLREREISASDDPQVNALIDKYLHGPRKIPNYSGGLGVLAGDTLKSFADMHIPVAAISLLYREGYFSQFVDSKVGQIDQATNWEPDKTPTLFLLRDPDNPEQPLEISIPFFNERDEPEMIRAQVWMKMELSEELDYFVPEFLVDYATPGAPAWVRDAAGQLYNSRTTIMKANQRRMLGSCVLPLMKALGLTARTIHLNEQHGVAVSLHLILRELKNDLGPDYAARMTDEHILQAVHNVAQHIVYTIHTPVKAGHDRFPRSMYSGISHKVCQRILDLLAFDDESPDDYNFTALAMRVNRAVNSVSRLHRDVTRRQFPRFADKITAVTNGVHHLTWISDNRARLFDSYAPLSGWRDDPGIFAGLAMDDRDLAEGLRLAWQQDNRVLIEYINRMLRAHRSQMLETWIDPPNYLSRIETEPDLEPGVFTIGFARRFSTYKRADLIFEDIDRLAEMLVRSGRKVNFVYAGKAHPADEPGKYVLKLILDNQEELYRKSKGLAKLIFIPGYDMSIARMMVAGVHAWLNSPKRPLEASGTSGMKAAMNGTPNISVMDGWWVEGYHDGQAGWKFGYEGPVEEANLSEDPDQLLYEEDAGSFYALFPKILETFYDRQDEYIRIALNNLRLNVPIFNTHRMAAEYVEKYDLRLDPETAAWVERFRALYTSDIPARDAPALPDNEPDRDRTETTND